MQQIQLILGVLPCLNYNLAQYNFKHKIWLCYFYYIQMKSADHVYKNSQNRHHKFNIPHTTQKTAVQTIQ
jgi:hypothetical protein